MCLLALPHGVFSSRLLDVNSSLVSAQFSEAHQCTRAADVARSRGDGFLLAKSRSSTAISIRCARLALPDEERKIALPAISPSARLLQAPALRILGMCFSLAFLSICETALGRRYR